MRLILISAMLLSCTAIADTTYNDIFKFPYIRYTASAEGSLGFGDFDWNIASNLSGNSTPNILSELKFQRLELIGHGLKGEIWVTDGPLKNTYWAMRAHHSAINDGTVQDSDYSGDNRSDEYQRTKSDAVGDKTYEIDSELGYQFRLNDSLALIPVVGLSLKGQRLRIGNPETIIPANTRTSYSNLDSTYFTKWEGINIGAHLIHRNGNHELRGYARFYTLDYNATADWNLRKEFRHPTSFEQSAKGQGYSFGGRYSYYFNLNWSGALELSHTSLTTDNGEDHVNFADGRHSTTRLNGANWNVNTGMIALEFHH